MVIHFLDPKPANVSIQVMFDRRIEITTWTVKHVNVVTAA